MNDVLVIVYILFAHYLADFPAQAFGQRWMKDKHKDVGHLTTHCSVYGLLLAALCYPLIGLHALTWAALNGLLHLIIDAITSRATHRYYGQHVHDSQYDTIRLGAFTKLMPINKFWCVIGFDQFLHVSLLIVTYSWL